MSAFTVFTYTIAIGLGIAAVPVMIYLGITVLTGLGAIVLTIVDSIERSKRKRVLARRKD